MCRLFSFLCIKNEHQGSRTSHGPPSVFNLGYRLRSLLALRYSALIAVGQIACPQAGPFSSGSNFVSGSGSDSRSDPPHSCSPPPQHDGIQLLSVINNPARIIVFPNARSRAVAHMCVCVCLGLQRLRCPCYRRAPQCLATREAAWHRPQRLSGVCLPTPARGFLARRTSWR